MTQSRVLTNETVYQLLEQSMKFIRCAEKNNKIMQTKTGFELRSEREQAFSLQCKTARQSEKYKILTNEQKNIVEKDWQAKTSAMIGQHLQLAFSPDEECSADQLRKSTFAEEIRRARKVFDKDVNTLAHDPKLKQLVDQKIGHKAIVQYVVDKLNVKSDYDFWMMCYSAKQCREAQKNPITQLIKPLNTSKPKEVKQDVTVDNFAELMGLTVSKTKSPIDSQQQDTAKTILDALSGSLPIPSQLNNQNKKKGASSLPLPSDATQPVTGSLMRTSETRSTTLKSPDSSRILSPSPSLSRGSTASSSGSSNAFLQGFTTMLCSSSQGESRLGESKPSGLMAQVMEDHVPEEKQKVDMKKADSKLSSNSSSTSSQVMKTFDQVGQSVQKFGNSVVRFFGGPKNSTPPAQQQKSNRSSNGK